MKELLKSYLKSAKDIIKKDGHFGPMAFPLQFNEEKEEIEFLDSEKIMFRTEEEKSRMFFSIGFDCRMNDCFGVVLVLEGAGRQFKTEEEKKYYLDNPETESIFLYPKSMRENMVIVMFVDFLDNEHLSLCCKYEVDEKNNIKFKRAEFEKNPQSGLIEMTVEGYECAECKIDETTKKEKKGEKYDLEEYENAIVLSNFFNRIILESKKEVNELIVRLEVVRDKIWKKN